MTLQWTFIAVFLYLEIFVVSVLLLPFISPTRWRSVFRSGLINKFANYSHIYFNVFIAILAVLFFDGVREVHKYAGPTGEVDMKHNPDQENVVLMRLFRAQRNLYIAGFALFLWFIIRRLMTLISQQAQLLAETEASKKQAQGATDAAKKLMEEKENITNMARLEDTDIDAAMREEKLKKQVTQLRDELNETIKELKKKETDLAAVKKQSEGTNKEYDRLLNELTKVQKKLDAYESEGGDKKSN